MMIPLRLNIAGVRDYDAIAIDLSDEQADILITGPNGVGKSTLTFCMGAALYSGKVDIEGLRSKNIAHGVVWRASIQLLFYNGGHKKVDAARYVQFSLHIEQQLSQPIVREFTIAEGDTIDEWEQTTTFKSGDKVHNFTEYKYQLQHKYGIDPDVYYLIWYQNEVNQFSDMHPQERFRIFSQMNDLDTIQKNWEESKEIVHQTQNDLAETEQRQQNSRLNLSRKEQELAIFQDRNLRLAEGFSKYQLATTCLEERYESERQNLKDQLENDQAQLDLSYDELAQVESELEVLNDLQHKEEQDLQHIVRQEAKLESQREQSYNQARTYQAEKQEMEKQIAHITEQLKRIPPEQEIHDTLHHLQQLYDENNLMKEQNEKHKQDINEKMEQLRIEQAEVNQQINNDEQLEKTYNETLRTYISSHTITTRLAVLDEKISTNKDHGRQLERTITDLSNEQKQLAKNRWVSMRQHDSLTYFAAKNIIAYPLRELLELDEQATLQDEKRLDAVKYTIFIDHSSFVPPNDLYHVSLPEITPEEYLEHLPELHIRVKENLSDKMFALAAKALWWLKQFFNEEQPVIRNSVLYDRAGRRGEQEKKQFILSEAALQKRKDEIALELEEYKRQQQDRQNQLLIMEKEAKLLRDALPNVQQAEAFFTKEVEREMRRKQQARLEDEYAHARHILYELEQQQEQLRTQLAEWNAEIKRYKEYKAFYEQFRQEQQKIKIIQQLDEKINHLSAEIERFDIELAHLGEQSNRLEHSQTKRQREIQQKLSHEERMKRGIENVSKNKEKRQGIYIAHEEHLIILKREYEHMHSMISTRFPQIVPEKLEMVSEWSIEQAKREREDGKITFELAYGQKNVDEAAPENYERMNTEYERSRDEVERAIQLLMENKNRMERAKESLENTIHLKILAIRQKFITYMGMFGFEGMVDWDIKEDRRGQIYYSLYLKARKDGHQGAMEDVSEKARGGKHGKGVSGGERSLVSLLFALALLQTIQHSPQFLVLDEFDSALDEGRKAMIFDLYKAELHRKMIIVTPRSHDAEYTGRFRKAHIVYHDASIPSSWIITIQK